MSMRKRIEKKIKDIGLTQEELASKLSISQSTLSNFLAGRVVKPKYLPELAKILGVTYDFLITGEDSGNNLKKEPADSSISSNFDISHDIDIFHSYASEKDGAIIIGDRILGHAQKWPQFGNRSIFCIYMPASFLDPLFEIGDVIYIDNDMPPKKMDYVLAYTKDEKTDEEHIYPARFINENLTHFYLRQFSPQTEIKLKKRATKLKQIFPIQSIANHSIV